MKCETLGGEMVSIRETDRYRHKYDSAMSEYLDTCMEPDHVVGDVDGPYDYCVRYGKRILFTDSQGFVSVDTYRSTSDALAVFDAISCADAIYWGLVEEGVDPVWSAVWLEADSYIVEVCDSIVLTSARSWGATLV